MKFNERLRAIRIEKGILQKQAAEEMKLSPTAYSNYEQGLREPDFATLKIICNYFEVSADYLIGIADSY